MKSEPQPSETVRQFYQHFHGSVLPNSPPKEGNFESVLGMLLKLEVEVLSRPVRGNE